MNILLLGNYMPDQQYSMQGFTAVLEAGMKSRSCPVRVIVPSAFLGTARFIPTRLRKWAAYFDKFVLFPNQLKKALQWADVVHITDHANAVYIRLLQGKPHVVTCHDVLAIQSAEGGIKENPVGWTGRIYQRNILKGLNAAQMVACVSERTQQDLLQISNRSAECTAVKYNGFYKQPLRLTREESLSRLREANISVDRKYFLHVGGNQFYKNRLGVLAIFASFCAQNLDQGRYLFMAGKPFTPEMRQFIADNGLAERVCELSGLNDATISALYTRAEALIFPSIYEGFGLPIIEAQAYGCPVFTTNRTPMTEVGGDAAIYFDPDHADEAARIIANHLHDRQRIIEAGYRNIERFSTEVMIEEYLQTYRKTME